MKTKLPVQSLRWDVVYHLLISTWIGLWIVRSISILTLVAIARLGILRLEGFLPLTVHVAPIPEDRNLRVPLRGGCCHGVSTVYRATLGRGCRPQAVYCSGGTACSGMPWLVTNAASEGLGLRLLTRRKPLSFCRSGGLDSSGVQYQPAPSGWSTVFDVLALPVAQPVAVLRAQGAGLPPWVGQQFYTHSQRGNHLGNHESDCLQYCYY